MPTTELQRRAALKAGNDVRIEGARQRRALIGAPMHVVVPALIRPTDELAMKRLSTLFTPGGHSGTGLIPKIGKKALHITFIDLLQRHPNGRQWWHSSLRLNELTELERRRLVNALVKRAPESWREGR